MVLNRPLAAPWLLWAALLLAALVSLSLLGLVGAIMAPLRRAVR